MNPGLPEKGRKRTFRINHAESGEFRLDYVLLPVGFAYNRDIAEAKPGDFVRLFNGGEYPIVAVRRVNLKSPNADLLSRLRYGMGIVAVLRRWQSNARLEGHGAKAVSVEECLWVVYDNSK